LTNKKSQLRYTIIIPLEFHRGQAEACLQQWAHEQIYAPDQYEILASGHRSSLNQEAISDYKSILRPHDKLLLYDADHDMALCTYAAQEAKGEFLFFTESHCMPEPNTLFMADKQLREHPHWAGFSGRTIPITHNRLSEVEADMYEADSRYGMQETSWRKVLDACFVVSKESYRASGGLRPGLGHFAEWHLAASLHQQGYRIEYTPEMQVGHYYIGNINELVVFSTDFVHGEMTYFSEFEHDPCRSYFEEPTEWRIRLQWVPKLARRALELAWRARSKFGWHLLNPLEIIARCRLMMESGLRAYYGPKPAFIWARLRFQVAYWILRLGLLLQVRRYFLRAIFLRFIDATVRLERIRFIQHWLKQPAVLDESLCKSSPTPSLIWQPDNSHTFCSTGFHAIEKLNGVHFRWSEPVGMIEVSLRPGNYLFILEWLPLKKINNLILYLDEKPMPIVPEFCKASSLLFHVSSIDPLRFSWTCEPWMAPRDQRLLGLPVTSISWMPANGAQSRFES
jgi:hypothetical protein